MKVLCLYEVRCLGKYSGELYWKSGSRVIDVEKSEDIPCAFEMLMAQEQRFRNPWDAKVSGWRLKSYLPESGCASF